MKLCQDCNTEKPETEFYRDRTRSDGLNWRCKPCHKAHVARVSMQPPKNPPPPGMKRCQRCKEIKPLDEFFADKNQYDGHARMCKSCAVSRHQQWVEENREQVNRYARQRYKNEPHRYAEYERKKHYGMPPGEYDRMLAAQDGRCAICKSTDPGGTRISHFHVDHCHDTNRIRGLLCGNCNLGIGYLRHDERILRAAIEYIASRKPQ